MGEFVLAGEGDVFTQENWAYPFGHLTCINAADLPKPEGDLTPVFCPDESQKGKFKIEGYIQGEPGAASTTLQMPLSVISNYLLEVKCPFNTWITYNCAGLRGDPENYQLAVLLYQMRKSNTSILAQAVAMGPDEESRIMTNAEVSYEDRLLFYQMAFAPNSLNNTTAANAISFLPESCGDKCTNPRDLCAEGYMAMDGTMYNSEVKYLKKGLSNWTQTAADPFTYAGGDASDVVTFQTATGHRAVVSRGSTTMGEPAEVAITTDWGANWTNVDVGAVNGQYINRLFPLSGRIWAACSGGYIYRSDNLGDSWITLEAGDETVQNLNDICMYDTSVGYAVGNSNAFLYTLDGVEWAAGTGPAVGTNLLSVAINELGHVFVGAADGAIYRSEDRGVNWLDVDGVAGAWRDFGAGSIDRIRFDPKNRYWGGLLYNNAAGVGVEYRTHDGGATWQAPAGQVGTWNAGLNDLWLCDQNTVIVVGEVFNTTTFMATGVATQVVA
jgi:photosystem II stability/assembly factor-like uncharacterized protein